MPAGFGRHVTKGSRTGESSMGEKISKMLGLDRKSERQKAFFDDANAYAGIYMSIVIISLELFMIGSLIHNVWFESQKRTTEWVIQHLSAYLVLITMAVLLLVFCIRYRKGHWRHSTNWGKLVMIIFSGVCLVFGMYISYLDFGKNEQILTFLTMILFAVCLLNWRPFVTFFVLSLTFIGFYIMMGWTGEITYATTINYWIYWVSILMVAISIYHQRRSEAEKSEHIEMVNERLEKMAVMDELTGIHNMNYFLSEAERILSDPDVQIENKVFLFLDIENFKTFNEKYGFEEGNRLLQRVAVRLENTFEGDLVARLSDDHFVVLTLHFGIQDKINMLDEVVREKMDEVYLGIKAGGYRPESCDEDIATACDHARYACAQIKANYDENYREYDRSMDEGIEKKHYIINHVRDAVANGYVKAYYQPVVWATDNTVCGTEALARWIDPKYGFLSPGDFIPALEDARQIHVLDRGIIEIVFRDLRERINSGEPVLPVSVNFSRLDFELYDVVSYLKEMMEKYSVPAEYIHVEVTESALTVHFEELRRTLEELKELGFTVWLDDFGSGYSSLNVLKDFEFSVVKIAMKFLSNFNSNHKTKPILNNVVRMADDIEMRTLTEGVETEEESVFLAQIGCERLQGFLFGKPMPKEELYEKIRVGELILSDKLLGQKV